MVCCESLFKYRFKELDCVNVTTISTITTLFYLQYKCVFVGYIFLGTVFIIQNVVRCVSGRLKEEILEFKTTPAKF